MNIKFPLLLIFSFLTGCAAVNPVGNSEVTQKFVSTSSVSTAQELVSGALIEINASAFPKGTRATLGDEYHSAFGKRCFKVVLLNVSHVQPLALCERKGGLWSFAPQIWPETGTETK